MNSPDLSVIIVSWNTKELLKNCLEPLFRETKKATLEVIVVDNASADGSPEMIEKEFPGVHLVRNEENLGFARANNQGIRESRGKHVFLLNPDTVVLDDAVDGMVRFLEQHAEIGGLCPKVLNGDGSVQSLGRTLPNLGNIFMQYFFPYKFYRALSDFLTGFKRRRKGQVFEVDGMPGAVMMVRREVFDDIGLMDEEIPLYGEDIDFCYRMKKGGWKIVCLSNYRVIHLGGRSTGLVPVESQAKAYVSQYHYIRKHHEQPAASAVKWMLVVSSFFRMLAWIFFRLAGNETGRRAALKVEAYRKLVRWGAGMDSLA